MLKTPGTFEGFRTKVTLMSLFGMAFLHNERESGMRGL